MTTIDSLKHRYLKATRNEREEYHTFILAYPRLLPQGVTRETRILFDDITCTDEAGEIPPECRGWYAEATAQLEHLEEFGIL